MSSYNENIFKLLNNEIIPIMITIKQIPLSINNHKKKLFVTNTITVKQ